MALKVSGGGPNAGRFAEAGVEVMAGSSTAPANGVIRNQAGNARRIRKGAAIPAGWSFDDGSEKAAPKKGRKKPAENTQAEGPSEQS